MRIDTFERPQISVQELPTCCQTRNRIAGSPWNRLGYLSLSEKVPGVLLAFAYRFRRFLQWQLIVRVCHGTYQLAGGGSVSAV